MIEKGTIIEGPDGQGYRVTRDCHVGKPILPTDFEPFGGAPALKGGEGMTPWLCDWLQDDQAVN